MFQDLDSTLKAILDNPGAPVELLNAEVSFETPDKNFAPPQATVNLFLHEVKENRELRDPVPITEKVGDVFVRRRPPLRVDTTYLVTTWSNLVGPVKVAEEHQLLSQSLQWLSRFGTIPDGDLQGSLVGQPFPPPTMVAQVDGKPNAGDFWNALGIPPRPTFTLVVTVAMEFGAPVEAGPPVVTKEIRLEQKEVVNTQEVVFEIAGTARDANTLAPIADAQVTILELGRTADTDVEGRFRFSSLDAGVYTLSTAANGFTTVDQAIVVPATTLNAYDMSLTP